MRVGLTQGYKDLKKPESVAFNVDYKELYGKDNYQQSEYPENDYENSDFKEECRVLIDKLKDIATTNQQTKDHIEKIYSKYLINSFAAGPGRNNAKQMKEECEKIYFQVKAAKEKNAKADFDGLFNNLEFECVDGTVGKLEELSRNLENDLSLFITMLNTLL